MYTTTLWLCEKIAYKNDYNKIDRSLYKFMIGLDVVVILLLGALLW